VRERRPGWHRAADVTGGDFQPVAVWAFVNSGDTVAPYGDAQPSLQVVMSPYTSLNCTVLDDTPEGGPIAYVLSVYPAGNASDASGTYALQSPPRETAPTPPYGTTELAECSGGDFNSCVDDFFASGTVTITSIGTDVTGTFSATLVEGVAPVAGSFTAPICQ
jgi:hypothetical protein